jgi:serine/threonine protein kinase
MTEEGKLENQARWQRMEEIYHAALPLTPPERRAFVARRCAGDVTLQEEVNSLLVSDDFVADFLQEPVVELVMAALADESLCDTEIVSLPAQPASADITGERVAGRYEVIKRLGGGGFGDVYKAADTKIMSRPVVIKVLKAEVLQDEGAKRDWIVTKFKQEIEALAKIDDPGVVRILDADALPDGRPYIVMEFVEGSDLRHFVKKERQEHVTEQGLRFEDVAEIIRQVGRTLTAAHEAEIFHRDLKPENIMLRRNTGGDMQVKVIDFGIAKVRNSLIAPSTATGLFVAGTWQYMAPEQLLGKKVDAACDIYALGVIAYELVTGRYPFPAKDPAKLKELQERGIKVKPCDLNPDLPTAAQEAILKALEYYPAERHERARDFGDELARALASAQELVRPTPPVKVDLERKTLANADDSERNENKGPVVVQPAPVPTSTSRRRLYRRWISAASVVLLAGVVSFGVWRSYRTTESLPPQQQQTAATSDVGPERTLIYWLSVQRKHDKEPFDSTGERIFDAGSKFWLNFQTTQAGALYLFSEGKNDDGEMEWNVMFPTPANNKGDALLPTNKSLRTAGYVFDDERGVVKIWVIWAAQRVQLLDDLVKKSLDVTPEEQGVISEPKPLQSFIERHRAPQPETALDKERFRVTLKGRGDTLIDMRELEYQP